MLSGFHLNSCTVGFHQLTRYYPPVRLMRKKSFDYNSQEISKLQKRREDSEETSQELRVSREQLQNTVC